MKHPDPLRVGVLGLLGLVLVVLAVFRVDDLPFLGGRATYTAVFADASGLKEGDPVEISGIEVGSVSSIGIAKTQVEVAFRIDDGVRLGQDSRAAVKVGSLLGSKYLEIVPAGTGRLPDDGVIPLGRTTPAYDIVEAFAELTETTEEIDKEAVASALDTISETFRGSTGDTRGVVRGLADLSATVADRDQEVRELLSRARRTTTELAGRRSDIDTLLRSTNLLLGELDARRDAIRGLLTTTTALSQQLRGLVSDNQATLTPALRDLQVVVASLEQRQDDLRATLTNMEIFSRVFTNTVGSGPWFDAIIPNLPTRISLGGNR